MSVEIMDILKDETTVGRIVTRKGLTKRDFLKAAGALSGALALAACGPAEVALFSVSHLAIIDSLNVDNITDPEAKNIAQQNLKTIEAQSKLFNPNSEITNPQYISFGSVAYEFADVDQKTKILLTRVTSADGTNSFTKQNLDFQMQKDPSFKYGYYMSPEGKRVDVYEIDRVSKLVKVRNGKGIMEIVNEPGLFDRLMALGVTSAEAAPAIIPSSTPITAETFLSPVPSETVQATETPTPTATATETATPTATATEAEIEKFDLCRNWEKYESCEIPADALFDGSYLAFLKSLPQEHVYDPDKLKFVELVDFGGSGIFYTNETNPDYMDPATRPFWRGYFGWTQVGDQKLAVTAMQYYAKDLEPKDYPWVFYVCDARSKAMKVWMESMNFPIIVKDDRYHISSYSSGKINPLTKMTFEKYSLEEMNTRFARFVQGDPTALDGLVLETGVWISSEPWFK
jgi:hypothetical protein